MRFLPPNVRIFLLISVLITGFCIALYLLVGGLFFGVTGNWFTYSLGAVGIVGAIIVIIYGIAMSSNG